MSTLRQLSGLSERGTPLSESALILIDCQNTYREGVMQLVGVEEALQEARKLLERARAAEAPIFHIQHDAGPGSPYDVQAENGQIADVVAPQGDEPVIVKHFPNSFARTDLHEHLQACGRQNLILAGFMSHMCVSSTARGAFDQGYRATVVDQATATRDLPDGNGGTLPAAAVHTASLAGIADLVAAVVKSQDQIES